MECDTMASSGDDRVTWTNYDRQNHRPHMDKSSRAKIFLPFNALEGLYETLEEKELKNEDRIELSDDEAQLLNEKLLSLKNGDFVTVTYYAFRLTPHGRIGTYITQSGLLTGISYELKTLRVRDTAIPIADILSINKRTDAGKAGM